MLEVKSLEKVGNYEEAKNAKLKEKNNALTRYF